MNLAEVGEPDEVSPAIETEVKENMQEQSAEGEKPKADGGAQSEEPVEVKIEETVPLEQQEASEGSVEETESKENAAEEKKVEGQGEPSPEEKQTESNTPTVSIYSLPTVPTFIPEVHRDGEVVQTELEYTVYNKHSTIAPSLLHH